MPRGLQSAPPTSALRCTPIRTARACPMHPPGWRSCSRRGSGTSSTSTESSALCPDSPHLASAAPSVTREPSRPSEPPWSNRQRTTGYGASTSSRVNPRTVVSERVITHTLYNIFGTRVLPVHRGRTSIYTYVYWPAHRVSAHESIPTMAITFHNIVSAICRDNMRYYAISADIWRYWSIMAWRLALLPPSPIWDGRFSA